MPVRNNELDLSAALNKLNGTYVVPEKYEALEYDAEAQTFNKIEKDHPYAGKTGADFTGRIILVHLNDGYSPVAGTVQLEDFGPISIYRVWNTGAEYAFANGADSVFLFNAVLDVEPMALQDAYDMMKADGTEVVNVSDGAVVLLSASSQIRADEQFRIWFGDNDLYDRAAEVSSLFRADWAFVETLDQIEFDDEFKAIVAEDELKYNAKKG